MITEKDRIAEWLTRVADQVYELRRKPRLSKEKRLEAVRQNYQVINVLIKVAEGKAFMTGITPPQK